MNVIPFSTVGHRSTPSHSLSSLAFMKESASTDVAKCTAELKYLNNIPLHLITSINREARSKTEKKLKEAKEKLQKATFELQLGKHTPTLWNVVYMR
jgi:hypothetical protein